MDKLNNNEQKQERVAIIGAGASGLAACKHAIDKGFNPTIFESEPNIGGVWAHTLESTKLQATASAYRYSDLAWPADVADTYPSHEKVMEYINEYACKFDLMRCIRFGSRVVGIEYVGVEEQEMEEWERWAGNGEAFGDGKQGEWQITVEDVKQGTTEIFQFDFLILCIGRFSGAPNIPDFPAKEGPEVFNGQVIHSMDYSYMTDAEAAQFVRGKRVTVVGSGKSAHDIAAECAKANGAEHPCTMICRTKHWLVHEPNIFGIGLGYFYLSRFSELMIQKPGQGFLSNLLATMLSPLRWGISKVIETYYKHKIPLKKHEMVPEYSFSNAMSGCLIAMLPEGFYDRVEEGSIVIKKSKSFTFNEDGVVLDGGDKLVQSDIVIFATGFRGDQKLRNLFVSPWLQKIVVGSSSTTVPLYRECIHPRIPQLAIIGYSESLTDMYVSERMSDWVAHFLAGGFQLPSIRQMEEDIQEWEKYKKRYNGTYFRKSCVAAVNIWYNDLLCQDMGCNPRRKKGFLAEWFQPYGPADYANL